MDEKEELNVFDIVDEASYFQYQKQEYAKLMEADSKAYEELKPLIAEQRADKGGEEESEEEAEEKIKEYLKLHNEGKDKNEYLVRGAELKCSCGSHTRKLNLSPCHGIYIKGHPVVHELDCFCGDKDNITWFGVCSNEDLESSNIIVEGENGEKIHGLKCAPEIVGVWIDSYAGTRIADNGNKMQDNPDDPVGCNTLTVGSFLVCKHGGIISPVNSGQDRKVELEEFVEGWSAYRRVMDLKINEEGEAQALVELPKKKKSDTDGLFDKIDKGIVHGATNEQVLGVLKSLVTRIPEKQILLNSANNLAVLTEESGKGKENGAFFQPNDPIENQILWESVKFGSANMADTGCEIIATYNARLALGEDMTEKEMTELISSYEREGAVLNGKWGVSPTAIYQYFASREYDVAMETSLDLENINVIGETYDTIIISFFNNQDNVTSGIHTVNITKEADGYYFHNGYTIDTATGEYGKAGAYDDLWDVVSEVSGGDAKPVSIIGINGKEDKSSGS